MNSRHVSEITEPASARVFEWNLSRRAFLKLPALLPFSALSGFRAEEHHFGYEGILGTSLDLVVWTPRSAIAEEVCGIVLSEIDRLASILSTRDPSSEISRFEHSPHSVGLSRELSEVLDVYDYWERRTGGVFSIRPNGANTSRNVDALGKAYIIDNAAKEARRACPSIEGLLLEVGGDIVVWGRSCEIAIADPRFCSDNAAPITTIALQNAAVATSGSYARGAHLIDARSGTDGKAGTAATVVSSDAATANALATTLCLIDAGLGFQLVESTPGAEALYFASGVFRRTSGFAAAGRRPLPQAPAATNWPAGYQFQVTLPLTSGRSKKRPYAAVWVEDSSGKLVRVLTVWGNDSKYYPDLSTAWAFLKRGKNQYRAVTRATRPAGKYELVWDGLDDDKKPAPQGTYRIVVETNQEHGTYAKQAGTITLGDAPATITLPATANFDPVIVRYGPK
jgi:thiamine biosynthesis lipoprotein